jgi:short-subunit dehydrogenase
VAIEDQRRLFDVIYWGVVHGTLVAAKHLRQFGGAIINVGSVLGEVAIPYQGAYCAAKFAVKGFTEAFRRETEADRLPISLTLMKPAAINSPFTDHARNRMHSPAHATRLPPTTRT